MTRWHADLHVHSRYSRATSRDADLEHMAAAAGRKGVAVIGTGDFTHPGWMAEIRTKLVPAGGAGRGTYRLRPEAERAAMEGVPAAARKPPAFVLTAEISTIYKRDGRTRKVHHVLIAPGIEEASRIAARLAEAGNVASDGRPILGMDSRDLLGIVLEKGGDTMLVPAHAWTPWFSVLGSRSGFDSIEECFGDLARHVPAIETGLSSDPPMNWRVSSIDDYRLVSFSDAHSPRTVGREATTFEGEPSWEAIAGGIRTGKGYFGTIEFFPEEGKYHLDGHRACKRRLTPDETLAASGKCPVCGKPVTVGVQSRVEALADRNEPIPPGTAGFVTYMVGLAEILAEIEGCGPATKKVAKKAEALIAALGPEISILTETPLEDVGRAGTDVLAEAVRRLRDGRVIRDAGYDGEYGRIRMFAMGEVGAAKAR